MRMSDTDEIGIDVGNPVSPKIGIRTEIFIHWIARCRVHDKEGSVSGTKVGGDGEPTQKSHPSGIELPPVQRARGGGQTFEAGIADDRHALCDGMIVVPANTDVGVLPDPVNARNRFSAVINQIAEDQTIVKRLVDRRKGRPIGMNIRQHENSHRISKSDQTNSDTA